MTDTKTVTLRVSPDQKEKWEEYVKEHPEAGNLSHLIRLSVHKEMGSQPDSDDAQVPRKDERIGELIESVNQIQDTLNSMQTRMSTLEHDADILQDFDVRKAVLAVLPTPPKSAYVPDEEGKGSHVYADADFEEWAVTPDGIAQQLGADETDVSDALDRLQELTNIVGRGTDGSGGVYYWRRE